MILGFIFDSVFIDALKYEKRNIFEDTIFANLFEGWSYEQVLATISKYETEYQRHFNLLLNAEIERISIYTPIENSTRKETTPHRLKAEKVLELASRKPHIRLVFDRKAERYERALVNKLYMTQINLNICEKINLGINQNIQIAILTGQLDQESPLLDTEAFQDP